MKMSKRMLIFTALLIAIMVGLIFYAGIHLLTPQQGFNPQEWAPKEWRTPGMLRAFPEPDSLPPYPWCLLSVYVYYQVIEDGCIRGSLVNAFVTVTSLNGTETYTGISSTNRSIPLFFVVKGPALYNVTAKYADDEKSVTILVNPELYNVTIRYDGSYIVIKPGMHNKITFYLGAGVFPP